MICLIKNLNPLRVYDWCSETLKERFVDAARQYLGMATSKTFDAKEHPLYFFLALFLIPEHILLPSRFVINCCFHKCRIDTHSRISWSWGDLPQRRWPMHTY